MLLVILNETVYYYLFASCYRFFLFVLDCLLFPSYSSFSQPMAVSFFGIVEHELQFGALPMFSQN